VVALAVIVALAIVGGSGGCGAGWPRRFPLHAARSPAGDISRTRSSWRCAYPLYEPAPTRSAWRYLLNHRPSHHEHQ
jgi:hypothetical protein